MKIRLHLSPAQRKTRKTYVLAGFALLRQSNDELKNDYEKVNSIYNPFPF